MPDTGLTHDEQQQLAAALHDGIDGDYLIDAGLTGGNTGLGVPISQARPQEVVWWAIAELEPVIVAIAEARARPAGGTGHYRYEHGDTGRGLILEPHGGRARLTVWVGDYEEVFVDLPPTSARALATALLPGAPETTEETAPGEGPSSPRTSHGRGSRAILADASCD